MKNSIDEIIAYNEYMNYLANNYNDPYGIDKIIDKLGTDYRRFFDNLISYIDKNIKKPKYVLIFERILEAIIYDTNLDVNKYLYNNGITPEELQTNLNKFLNYFRPDMKYTNENLPRLHAILQKYTEYSRKIKETNALIETKDAISKRIILEFINSPYSLERFILPKRLTSADFNKILDFTRQHDKVNYQLFQDSMNRKEEIKNATIESDILTILTLIKELKDDFTSIDLFKATLYGPRELVKAADNYLTGEDLKLFRSQVNKYRIYTFTTTILTDSATEGLIKTKLNLTINNELVETTEEERQTIVDDLNSHSIPITSKTFFDAYNKYYQDKKVKTYKA